MKNKVSIGRYSAEKYGRNAGKIWKAINKYGPLNQSSIIKYTKLTLNDFYTGIGWLARENKIYIDKKSYKLGDTNLTNTIGENAGKIWKLLDTKGKSNASSISKSSDIKIKDVYSAIGWLSRENKLKMIYKNKQIIYELT
jgi:hypothetical protein